MWLFLLWNHAAYASSKECTTIDFTHRFGPLRHQGNTAYCFAFAAADLLGAESGIQPPDQISALDIVSSYISSSKEELDSLRQNINFENVPLNNSRTLDADAIKTGAPLVSRAGGYDDIAMAKALKEGKACLETELPSQSLKYPEIKARAALDPIQYFLEDQVLQRSGHKHISDLRQNIEERQNPANCTNLVSTIAIIQTELLPAINDWAAAHLRQSIVESCRQPVHLKNVQIHRAYFIEADDKRRSLKTMNRILESGHPFILGHHSTLLEGGHPKRSEILNHSSVVTGRRWNSKTNRCEVQIRNSYGKQCFNVSSEIECHKGYTWVSQEAIANSDHRMIYLTPTSK